MSAEAGLVDESVVFEIAYGSKLSSGEICSEDDPRVHCSNIYHPPKHFFHHFTVRSLVML